MRYMPKVNSTPRNLSRACTLLLTGCLGGRCSSGMPIVDGCTMPQGFSKLLPNWDTFNVRQCVYAEGKVPAVAQVGFAGAQKREFLYRGRAIAQCTLAPSAKIMGLIIEHTRRAVSLLRLQPFDISTAEGRSQERYRRAGLTALGSLAGKGLSFLTLLISVPLTLHYLGAERFGMWMTISSVITMLTFADLGIGNALLNLVSEANGKDSPELASRLVSSAFFTVTGVSAGLALVFAFAYPFVAWSRVFNVTSQRAISESGPALAVFAACFFMSLPLNLAPRVQLGYQDGIINDIWSGIGNVTGLIGVLIVICLRGGLPWLVLAFSGGTVLATFMNGFLLFVFQRPWLRPKPENFSAECVRRLSGLGSMFLFLQISICLAFLSDNIIVAHVISASAVAQYAVPQRMFGIVSILIGLLLGPLWPAYAEAVARGDYEWARRTFRRSILYAVLFSGGAAAV